MKTKNKIKKKQLIMFAIKKEKSKNNLSFFLEKNNRIPKLTYTKTQVKLNAFKRLLLNLSTQNKKHKPRSYWLLKYLNHKKPKKYQKRTLKSYFQKLDDQFYSKKQEKKRTFYIGLKYGIILISMAFTNTFLMLCSSRFQTYHLSTIGSVGYTGRRKKSTVARQKLAAHFKRSIRIMQFNVFDIRFISKCTYGNYYIPLFKYLITKNMHIRNLTHDRYNPHGYNRLRKPRRI